MRPGSHRPPVPSPLPCVSLLGLPMQVSREEKGTWEERRALKRAGVGIYLCTSCDQPLLGTYGLLGEAWDMSQRDQAKRSSVRRSIQPQAREGSLGGQGPPTSQPVAKRGRLFPKGPRRKEKRELREKGKEEGRLGRRGLGGGAF